MNPKVDFYFNKAKKWQDEIVLLRKIVLDCDIREDLKWGCPCYIFQEKNIVLIHSFKEYCALLFFKGALLKDPNRILIQQTENVQAARQIRFTSKDEIVKMQTVIKNYIYEAIEIDEAGLKVKLNKKPTSIPDELQEVLSKNTAFKTAFEALTPGRQRGYILYFSAAKQSKTRTSRIENSMEKIFSGKGWNE